jgi:site-specific DNA recombinase
MKPWVVYTRVSTTEQAVHGVSLDAQRESCSLYLRAHGLPLGEVIEDGGASAKNLRRPGMQRLLAMIARGEVGGIIAWKLDRLSRSVRDLWDLIERAEKSHCAVACVQEKIDTSGPFGRFAVTILGAIAQLEREQTGERVTMAKRHIKAQGGFSGGPIPSGLRVSGPKGGRRLEIDPATAPAVAQTWRMVVAGASLRQVAEHLNATVPTRRGKSWASNTVSDLLRLPTYVGLLVSRETFDAAQRVLGDRPGPRRLGQKTRPRTAMPSARAQRVYLLAGLATCAHCGAALVGTYGTGRSGPVHYYRCSSNNRRGAAGCKAGLLPAEQAETAVVRAVRVAIDRDSGQAIVDAWRRRADEVRAAVGPAEEDRQRLTLERDQAQARVDSLLASLAEASPAAARAISAGIEKAQLLVEQAEGGLLGCEARLAAAAVADGDALAAREVLRDAVARLEASAGQEQAEGLRAVLRHVTMAVDVPRIEMSLRLDPPEWFAQSAENGGVFPAVCEPLSLPVGVEAWFHRGEGWRLPEAPLPPPVADDPMQGGAMLEDAAALLWGRQWAGVYEAELPVAEAISASDSPGSSRN